MSRTSAKPLDLESLKRLTFRLRQAIDAFAQEPENLYILDSLVKRFEMTFEISRRLLRRFLIDIDPKNAKIPPERLHEFIALGNEEDLLLGTWIEWKPLLEARNTTVHGYYEEKAREIAAMAEPLLAEALFLLNNLKQRTPQDAE